MAALTRHLAPATLRTSDELGIPAGGKEAVMWALLGFLLWYGVPGASAATGAAHPRLLGRISPGERPLVLPVPRSVPPSQLRLRAAPAAAAATTRRTSAEDLPARARGEGAR
jgi:anhydro-N-acetylmuramic acid kinase